MKYYTTIDRYSILLNINLRSLIIIVLLVVMPYNLAGAIWGKSKKTATLINYVQNVNYFAWEFPQEKVYLQFDNTSYVQGETIWFKAYVVDALNLHRSRSKVLYVELLDAKGHIVKSQKLKIVAGQADGYFDLIEDGSSLAIERRAGKDYPSGYYEVRAYTANMLNFGDGYAFSRVFPVMQKNNTMDDFITSLHLPQSEKITRKDPRPIGASFDEMNVSFYPEGGRMIIGKPCRVAFKVTDKNGLGLNVHGLLADSIIVTVDHDGMGSFTFTPKRYNYRIRLYHDNGYSKAFSLPAVEKSGCTVMLGAHNDTILPVKVMMSNDIARNNDSLGVVVLCRGIPYYYESLPLVDSKITDYEISIPMTGWPDGVFQLCVFDILGKKLASRMFYSDGHVDYPEMDICLDKEEYKPFDPVRVRVGLNYRGKPFKDRICLSVRDKNNVKSPYSADLRTSMLLASDLAGLIWNPDYYFESDDAEHRKALDLLCMVQGWERYDWNIMSGLKKYEEKHRLEDSIMLNGWVLSPFLERRLNGVGVYANVILPDSTVERFSMVTSQNGYFGMNLSDFEGYADMYIWSTGTPWNRLNGTNNSMLLERSIRPATRRFMPFETILDTTAIQREPARFIDRILDWERVEEDQDTISELARIRKQGDGSYLIPDVVVHEKQLFVDYATFEEYNVRYDVETRMDNAGFSKTFEDYLMELNNTLFNDLFSMAFMVHCDKPEPLKALPMLPYGLDTYNIENIQIYDDCMKMSLIDTIAYTYELMRPEMYTMTQFSFYGMSSEKDIEIDTLSEYRLIEITLKPTIEQLTYYELLDISRRQIYVKGFSNSKRSFYSPQYPDGAVTGEIDHRRTLYWNPNLVTDDKGNAVVDFYNNSYTRHFSISAVGMTATGLPYCADIDW